MIDREQPTLDAPATTTASVPAQARSVVAADALRPGDVVAAKYRVECVLGTGGMGVVVSATHLALGERVALKLLRASPEPAYATRFLREARSAVRIKSEHVARVLDVSTLETGAPYIVLEYLTGEDFGRVLEETGPLGVEEVADCVLQACVAMAEAHSMGIIHRDLKPSNLFRTRRPDGSTLVKVLDFGIAKASADSGVATGDLTLTAAAEILGSPAYMSPEQVKSATRVDTRTDVWSLGVILHELLTARRPFEAESISGILSAIAADPPTRLGEHLSGAPPALEALILRCLQKDRERRTQSVAALARELAPFASAKSRPLVARVSELLGAAGDAVPLVESPAPSITGDAATLSEAWGSPRRSGRKELRYLAIGLGVGLVGGAVALASLRRAPPPSEAGGAPVISATTALLAPPSATAQAPEAVPAPPAPASATAAASSEARPTKPRTASRSVPATPASAAVQPSASPPQPPAPANDLARATATRK